MRKIVITGPESSGKTTLAKNLASRYNIPWIEEFSRTYLSKLDRPYVYTDLLAIAKGQLKREESYKTQDIPFVFCDTSMLVMKVWSEYKYRKVDPWIIKQLTKQKYSLFLLCKPDIPWEYDPLRENPNDRDVLFYMYLKSLQQLDLPFAVISGSSQQQRLKDAQYQLQCHWPAINKWSNKPKI